jgi:hypothetical protein
MQRTADVRSKKRASPEEATPSPTPAVPVRKSGRASKMPKWLGDDEFMTGAELATITKQDTSRFIGVRLRERDGNFEVSIKHGGRTLSLGSFSLEREAEAAAAYDAAARRLRGPHPHGDGKLQLNFPTAKEEEWLRQIHRENDERAAARDFLREVAEADDSEADSSGDSGGSDDDGDDEPAAELETEQQAARAFLLEVADSDSESEDDSGFNGNKQEGDGAGDDIGADDDHAAAVGMVTLSSRSCTKTSSSTTVIFLSRSSSNCSKRSALVAI